MTAKTLCWSSSFSLLGLALAPSLHASDRIETTLMDFGLNQPDNFHAEMNRQMNWRPNLNTNFHGNYAASGLIPESPWLRNLTAFAEFHTTWFESDTTPDLESDIHKFFLGASAQTSWNIDLGLIYSRSSFDFDSFDDNVSGDGDADRYGVYLHKRFDFGLKLGATYSYSEAEMDAEDTVFSTAGNLDQTGHAFSLAIGYARKFGEDTIGKNIAFDTSANLLYSNDDYDAVNGPPAAALTGGFEYETLWFSWRSMVAHNLGRHISVFASFTLHQRLDADERDSVQSFFGAFPDKDETIGELGGGVVVILGRGLSAHAFARTDILNDIHTLATAGIGLAYKF
jgi:outer membrane autotransporter protein